MAAGPRQGGGQRRRSWPAEPEEHRAASSRLSSGAWRGRSESDKNCFDGGSARQAFDIRVVARELGVRSVLEGSIRRSGSRVRITAQLIDAETGGHLWADRFDRELSDIFAVQDEVTRRIVDALKIKLSPGEAARFDTVETINSKAHDFFLLGREVLWGTIRNRETFERSTDLLEKAIGERSELRRT